MAFSCDQRLEYHLSFPRYDVVDSPFLYDVKLNDNRVGNRANDDFL